MAQLVVPPAYRERHRRALRRLLAGGRARLFEQRIELEAQHADGSLFPVELAVTRLAGAGPTAQYTGFVRDLTDHKLAEHERKQTELQREHHETRRRQIEIVAAVVLIPSLVAAIYGTNTATLGGKDSWPAFAIMLMLMVAAGSLALWYLRHVRLKSPQLPATSHTDAPDDDRESASDAPG